MRTFIRLVEKSPEWNIKLGGMNYLASVIIYNRTADILPVATAFLSIKEA